MMTLFLGGLICVPPLPQGLSDSAILATVGPDRLAAFLRELCVWLPRRAYTLLYRGSRDGMTAAAFHRLCDGKGPTLVLVRSDTGCVFGGHAGASWTTPVKAECDARGGKCVGSDDAFLFSVNGPVTAVPVPYPAKSNKAHEALYCHAGYGPTFDNVWVTACNDVPTDSFDEEGCACELFDESCFEDVIGVGGGSLTGTADGHFVPVEVEVYAVALV
ncbi:MAG: TLD domain-containing protein [Terracidiphilus sp.]|nr:TLD domain-containing protein [Terracidiphilus sp.]